MKKIWMISIAAALALTFSACGVGDVGNASSAAASSQAAPSQAASSAVSADSVEDSLSGLESYLTQNAGVSGTPEAMQADIIGAKSGVRYKYSYNGGKNNITLELYEYDPSSLSATAQQVVSSVKSKGSFTLLDKDVNATLSGNAKYLAIVTDSATDDADKAYVQKLRDLVAGFKK